MEHPIQRLVESIHNDGSCPRLKVDLTRDGIVCPDFVCEKWGEELVIDLDPSYPLDLAFTATGIDVDLSFGGYVTRCTFPYASIYMVADRATGKGIMINENTPSSVRDKRRPAPTLAPAPAPSPERRTKPARDKLSTRKAGESRRRRRRKESEADAEVPAQAAENTDTTEDTDTTEEVAKPRRLGLVAVETEEPTPEAADETEKTPESEPEAAPKAAPKVAPAAAPKAAAGAAAEAAPETADAEPETTETTADQEAKRRRSVFKVIDGGK